MVILSHLRDHLYTGCGSRFYTRKNILSNYSTPRISTTLMNTNLPTSAWVILKHGSHYYFLKRSEKSKHWPCYWGFPWGKKESGETLFEAAQRELLEETWVHIDEIDITGEIIIHAKYIDGERNFVLYLCNTWIWSPENLEKNIHPEDGWFTIDNLPYPILPHIAKGFFRLLDGVKEIEYDWRGDIFE